MNTPLSIEPPIVITGGTGMLASSLFRIATEQHSFSREDIVHPGHTELDIRDTKTVNQLILREQPGCLINTAAYTDVDACETRFEEAMEVNGEAPGNLAEICENNDIPFVHYSTDYVFDGTKNEPYTENDPPDPINRYGETKLRGEETVLKRHEGALVIRSSWLYGPGGSNFVDGMRNKLEEGKTVSVVTDQVGSPTFTDVVSRATFHLLGYGQPGIFHATCKGETSWYKVAKEIKERLALPGSVVKIKSDELDREAPRPGYSVLSSRKLHNTGQTTPHWKKCLREYLRKT